jgi:hypothetical protein
MPRPNAVQPVSAMRYFRSFYEIIDVKQSEARIKPERNGRERAVHNSTSLLAASLFPWRKSAISKATVSGERTPDIPNNWIRKYGAQKKSALGLHNLLASSPITQCKAHT